MAKIEEAYRQDIAFKGDFKASASGDLQIVNGLNNVKDSLIRRLITSPGTLIHRPTYGVGIKSFDNALNNIDNQRELANRIKVQFEQDDRVESVVGMRVLNADSSPEKIIISVRINLVGIGETELRAIPFNERVGNGN